MPHLDSEKKKLIAPKIKFTQAKKDRDEKELKVNIKPIIRSQAGLKIKKNILFYDCARFREITKQRFKPRKSCTVKILPFWTEFMDLNKFGSKRESFLPCRIFWTYFSGWTESKKWGDKNSKAKSWYELQISCPKLTSNDLIGSNIWRHFRPWNIKKTYRFFGKSSIALDFLSPCLFFSTGDTSYIESGSFMLILTIWDLTIYGYFPKWSW